MRRYVYKAKNKETDKIVKGVIQAENERAAGKLLVEQGFSLRKLPRKTKTVF